MTGAAGWLSKTPAKLSAYTIGLVLIFGAAAGAGRVINPDRKPAPAAHSEGHASPETPRAEIPGGLQVAQDGYRLRAATRQLSVGTARQFLFQVLGPDDKPVTSYTENHDKDLHLILVRRDMSGYQHLHPTRGSDGTWSIPISVGTPGQYRVLADFQPAAHHEAITLGIDVPAPGDYRPVPLPAPATTAEVDGYTVTMTGELSSGELGFTVSRDGGPVTGLEPYLGALGHLVVLREGDLAYLHVHPAAEDALAFAAEIPSPGAYRLYLDFQHGGKVRTAEFTAVTAAGEYVVPETPEGHADDGHTHD